MRLAPKPRHAAGTDDGVIPMINIVFLLLVFFMVAGTVRPADPIDTEPPATSREGDLPIASRVLHLGSGGALALDGERVESIDLARLLAPRQPGDVVATAKQSDRATVARAGVEEGELIALQADANVSFTLLRDTIDALRRAGVQRVELVTASVAMEAP